MDGLVRRQLGLEGIGESDKLLMAMVLYVAPDDRAIEHFQRREQRGCAIALVFVGHRRTTATLERKAWLGPIERLDLALFFDRQHDRMSRR